MSLVCFHLQKTFSPFHVVDVGYIKALLQQVTSCQHQLIIQEVDLENTPFSALELAYINGKFLTSGDRMASMTFD